jgi:hypothetical protein
MGRFQLNIYAKDKPKGKSIKKKMFDSPKEARLSKDAQKAVYYEIVDQHDKRIIEIKIEEGV